jgi:hypothetical protein
MVGVVTEILLAEVLTNNTRMMLWPFAIQLTGYLHHFPGLYSAIIVAPLAFGLGLFAGGSEFRTSWALGLYPGTFDSLYGRTIAPSCAVTSGVAGQVDPTNRLALSALHVTCRLPVRSQGLT